MLKISVNGHSDGMNSSLTCDENQQSSGNIFTKQFSWAIHYSFHNVIIPGDVDGNITGQSVSYENAKCQHSFCQLSKSENEHN